MKRILHILPAAALLLPAALFMACDDINNDDRLIEVEFAQAERTVLAMEFTGQNCTNCPEGAKAMEALREAHPGDFISVNMHPDNTYYTNAQIPSKYDIGLTSHEATVMYDYFKPDAFPAAIFDGCVFDGQVVQNNISQWGTYGIQALAQPSPLKLTVSAGYDPNTGMIMASAESEYTGVLEGEARIMFWVIENHIIGYQLAGGKPNREYEHNHVLRASMNGDWGQVSASPSDAHPGTVKTDEAAMEKGQDWVVENLEVVAFVFYQTPAFSVLQSAICDVAF